MKDLLNNWIYKRQIAQCLYHRAAAAAGFTKGQAIVEVTAQFGDTLYERIYWDAGVLFISSNLNYGTSAVPIPKSTETGGDLVDVTIYETGDISELDVWSYRLASLDKKEKLELMQALLIALQEER